MGLGSFLKNKLGKKSVELKVNLEKSENRDLVQAGIGIAYYFASAEGGVDADEEKAIENVIAASPALKHFSSEIHAMLDHCKAQAAASRPLQKMHLFRELDDVAHDPKQKEEAFLIGLSVALAGGISDAERTAVYEVAGHLGLKPEKYGVQ